ncbi:MAG: D-2-hydroxyacid dehydrogenase [Christensenellales bacterium]|jgi:glycerate dehydrogenase
MKIVVLDGYTVNPGDLSWDALSALGDFTVYDRTPVDDSAEIVRRIGDAQIIFTNKTPIDRAILEQCPQIRYVGVLATGYNVVDIEAAREHGVVVTNVPAYGTAAVAQFAIALLLEICHGVRRHSDAVHAGRWTSAPDFCFWDSPQIELAGKTMGIIGFGRIGQATGRIAGALGMRVIAYNAGIETDEGRGIGSYVTLEELLAQSDVISLHCPLTPETQGIINQTSISRMKDGVILINNSRGPLIVEDDLAAALKSGKVYAAGLDVVSVEPIRADNPLLGAPNCVITPHISWASRDARARLLGIAVENLRGFIRGETINAVNA